MKKHTFVLLPATQEYQDEWISLGAYEQFAELPYTKGQTSLEAPAGFIDVHAATKKSGGAWSIIGWFTPRSALTKETNKCTEKQT